MIKKVLIANRGEIAIRVMRGCRELGIATVAVFSDADTAAMHTHYADEAVHIGASPSRESYLRIDKLIEVAKQTGADAIHPGYGFLSERAEFARAITDAGLIFIGPSADAIAAMGSKTAARRRMKAVGVPVAPGIEDPVSDPDVALKIAGEIGFPLLIKAAHGGGGKGMRKVYDRSELASSLEAAMRESLSAFGSNEVFLERFVENPHHIEFQVLADTFGNTIHLGERECSVQRRHQKLVEESPSPFMTPELRERMGEAAVKAAQAVGYVNAGTVEFLVDADRNFYFLEMNTRLQVEHPVTEFVTGIDLVKAQLLIASGEKLPWLQNDVVQRGWSIECRICAEDPLNNFLPSTGKIESLTAPTGPGVRDDRGFGSGDEITLFYDSLLAKLICYGSTREDAIARTLRALEEYRIVGIKTTIPFFKTLLQHPIFVGGDYNTSFIEQEHPETELEASRQTARLFAVIAGAISDELHHSSSALHTADSNGQRSPVSLWKSIGRMRQLGRN